MSACARCGRDRDPKIDTTHVSYCRECWRTYQRDRWRHGLPVPSPVTCEWCGETFTPKQNRSNVRFCSREHKQLARIAATAARRAAERPYRRCEWCGTGLEQTRSMRARFCSARCNNRAHYLSKSKRMAVRLAARDGAWCGICGAEIDMSISWPDLWSSSIDHVIPVSLGGSDDLDNLRLAHLTCNCARKART